MKKGTSQPGLISFRDGVGDVSNFDQTVRQLERDLASADQRFKIDGNRQRLKETRLKRRFISELQEDYSKLQADRHILFVSLSGRYRKELDTVKMLAQRHGFTEVLTGFDDDMLRRGTLREGILGKIAKCSAFLGVWTCDLEVKDGTSNNQRHSPGIWMPLELGAALYAGKPFRLALEEGVWDRLLGPVSEFPHGWFRDQRSFDSTVDGLIRALREKLSEVGDI